MTIQDDESHNTQLKHLQDAFKAPVWAILPMFWTKTNRFSDTRSITYKGKIFGINFIAIRKS